MLLQRGVEVAVNGSVHPHSTSFKAKDLRIFGRPLSEVVLVDNTVSCGFLQPRNLLPISTWKGDVGDTALLQLIPILEGLAALPDVREALDRHVEGCQN